MPFIKIASADLTNDILLEEVSKFNKPILLSTGASTIKEIERAVDILKPSPEIVLLHCTLNYPTLINNAFLERIIFLKNFLKTNIKLVTQIILVTLAQMMTK